MIMLIAVLGYLFDSLLIFLQKYPAIGILMSAIIEPLTYYLGQPIGIIVINKCYFFFISMIFFWVF